MTCCYLCSAEPVCLDYGPDGRLRPVCQDHAGTNSDTWGVYRRAHRGKRYEDDEEDEEVAPTEEDEQG